MLSIFSFTKNFNKFAQNKNFVTNFFRLLLPLKLCSFICGLCRSPNIFHSHNINMFNTDTIVPN